MRSRKILLLTIFLVLIKSMLFAQSVTGVVTDPDGKKLQSVSVTVPGTSVGTATDLNGNYKITVPANATELMFSIVGYQSQTVAVGGRNEVNVTLQLDYGALADVVVVGYGTQRKRDVTGHDQYGKGR
jgi:hypothetical protein